MLPGGGAPPMSSPYKSREPPEMSGEVGWTAEGMHPHHALGNFSGMGSRTDPCPGWGDMDSNSIIGALGAQLDHKEYVPLVQVY